jgi:ubiquinol-cytochrome c reductase cytochrome c1 subunit
MFKHLAWAALLILPAGPLLAQEGGDYLPAKTDFRDTASLRRGAHNFIEYCSGCHSLKYLRYNRMAQDLDITPAELSAGLMFASDKPFDPIVAAMPGDAEKWLGKQPPDLSLTARAKGGDYIYSFMKGFYVDTTRPWGVNNRYLENASMPFVLEPLQGLQKPVFQSETDAHGDVKMVLKDLEPMTPGALSAEKYDAFVRDIVNFLDYAAEPIKAKRRSLGIFVTLFLLVFFAFAYMLKKEYWKDVH